MKVYLVKIEWKIMKEGDIGGYKIGTNGLKMKAKNKLEVVNRAIEYCENIPDYHIESNNIILDKNFKYETRINKIISIEVLKDEVIW